MAEDTATIAQLRAELRRRDERDAAAQREIAAVRGDPLLEQQTATVAALRVIAPSPTDLAGQRLYFVDHLRVLLTVLVILEHLALTYGGIGPWYYQERAVDPAAMALLSIFVLLNQAFFMGCFFLISAYFIPRSYDRKGTGAFIKDRLVRLGIPLLIYQLLLNPLAMLGFRYGNDAGAWMAALPDWQFYLLSATPGPLWFVETLLLFNVAYALWRHFGHRPSTRPVAGSCTLGYRHVGQFAVVLAIATFLLRLCLPMGLFVPLLDLPTASHLPQYVSLFIIGLIAYRNSWFATVPDSTGRVGFGVAGVATALLLPLALSDPDALVGGLRWQAAVYALWESLFCVGMCLGLLTLFRRRLDRPGRVRDLLAAHAYTVYIIHAPILVALAFALRGIEVYPLLKFALAASTAIPLCLVVAQAVRRLPLAQRVL